MIPHWIINASPLIVLGKANLLGVISPLATVWIIPNRVIWEVSKKTPVEPLLAQLTERSQIHRPPTTTLDPIVVSWNLGEGESEVLTLALSQADHGVVLDDLQARKCAQVLGLPLMGSLGLLVKAKKDGLIDSVTPALNRLSASGLYLHPRLVSQCH